MNVPDDVPEVACSQSDLEQVFLNLLTNAREATPHGGRITRLGALGRPARRNLHRRQRMRHCRGESAAGARAVLHDQAARQRPRPVDLPSVLWEVEGTLTIRQRARHRHRGARLRSRRRRATAPATGHETGAHPRRRRRTGHAARGRARAERRPSASSATRLSLDALALANEFHPELAIVDIRMPDLDGFELMARLKARFPALDVILMTGSVDDLDEKLVRAIRSRAFYFIQKPFDRDVLRTLVERCVELRWRREDHRQNLKRLETEMAEARAFQQSLLPDRERVLNRLSVCCRYTPCSALGGDLYDYADATAGRTALLIADVVGPWRVGCHADRHREERLPRVARRRFRARWPSSSASQRAWLPSAPIDSSR